MGDAAHAMVPYMSQGAAIAVEDGAALPAVLSLVETAEEISAALKVFETVRIKRSGQMQAASLLNGKLWHFADGPEQVLRDESMRPEVEGRSFSWSPHQWSDPVTQWWAYGYDAREKSRRSGRGCLWRHLRTLERMQCRSILRTVIRLASLPIASCSLVIGNIITAQAFNLDSSNKN